MLQVLGDIMLFEKFEILLALLAGLVVLIVGIVVSADIASVLIRLLIALISFWLLGKIIKIYLKTKVFVENKQDEPHPQLSSDDMQAHETEIMQAQDTVDDM